jgi:hypothetical protein
LREKIPAAITQARRIADKTHRRNPALPPKRAIHEINPCYVHSLTPDDIVAGNHRGAVGRMWEEIGNLQFEFLTARGPHPHHHLPDVGCGALRGGIHFIRYLVASNYHGVDVNASLIEAGRHEIAQATGSFTTSHSAICPLKTGITIPFTNSNGWERSRQWRRNSPATGAIRVTREWPHSPSLEFGDLEMSCRRGGQRIPFPPT